MMFYSLTTSEVNYELRCGLLPTTRNPFRFHNGYDRLVKSSFSLPTELSIDNKCLKRFYLRFLNSFRKMQDWSVFICVYHGLLRISVFVVNYISSEVSKPL